MGLGLSFGSNSTNVSQQTNKDLLDVTKQSGSTGTNQSQSGSSSTVGSQTGNTTGATKGSSASTQTNVATGQQQQKGTTTSFSDAVLSSLEAAGLGGIANLTAQGAIDTSSLDGFDPTAFVSDAANRAEVAGQRNIDIGRGGLFDSIGGTSGGNTMAALLEQQLRTEQAAGVSGARADATAQANEIVRQNLATRMAGRQQEAGVAGTLLDALKGGTTTSDTTGTNTESSNQQNQGSNSQLTSELQSLLNQSQSSTNEQLVSMVNQLLNGSTKSTGTESMTGKTKEKGSGFGLSL